MKAPLSERPRKVDLETLSREELDEIIAGLGHKIGEVLKEAAVKSRKYLDPYGLDIKFAFVTFAKGTEPPLENPFQTIAKEETKKKTSKKKKASEPTQ